MSSSPAKCAILTATEVSLRFLSEIAARPPPGPHLVAVLATADKASESYAQWTQRTCAGLGIQFTLRKVERSNIEKTISNLNGDASVHGVMVYYPVFGPQQDQYIQNCISPEKDVEGLCHMYKQNLYNNIRFVAGSRKKSLLPCTPLAVVKILEHIGLYKPNLKNLVCTIVNRSEVVGRPLAALLAHDGALVYSVDINDVLEFRNSQAQHHEICESAVTREDALRAADVVISAVPSASYKLPVELLKPGVIAINVASAKNIDAQGLPPGSTFVADVGKVTVAMLLRNLLRLYDDSFASQD